MAVHYALLGREEATRFVMREFDHAQPGRLNRLALVAYLLSVPVLFVVALAFAVAGR